MGKFIFFKDIFFVFVINKVDVASVSKKCVPSYTDIARNVFANKIAFSMVLFFMNKIMSIIISNSDK